MQTSLSRLSMRIGHWNSLAFPALPPPSIPLLLCFLFLGAARYQIAQPTLTPEHIAWYNGQNVKLVVKGKLIDPPDNRDQFTYLRLRVEQFHPEDQLQFQTVRGLLLARVEPGGPWRYGDLVRLEGYLEEPFANESFSFRDYLARQDIFSVLNNASGIVLETNQGSPLLRAIFNFRDIALSRIYAFFPDPEASLLVGILLGVRTGIPAQVDEAFRATGTSHVIAISGFNITILAGLFTFIFCRLIGRKRGMVVTILMVILYTILVGASAAVVRAAILAIIGLFGHEIGRQQTGVNSLSIVAAFMALIQPGVLGDVGFQLSFAATLGLILYANTLMDYFTTNASRIFSRELISRISAPVGAYLLFTFAAQFTTLPLILHYTGDLSLTALVANPLILPAQPPLMILGGVSVLLGLISRAIGQLFAYIAWPFLAFTIRSVEWLAAIPGGVLHLGRLSWHMLIMYYIILFGWSFRRWMKQKELEQAVLTGGSTQADNNSSLRVRISLLIQQRPWLPLIMIGLLTLFIWREALSAPNGKLRISILDVGTGEAILIRTPDGRNVLVNGGQSGMTLADSLGRRLPLSRRQFDWWVIANADEEGVSGLATIYYRYPPANVLWAGHTHGTYTSRKLWGLLNDANFPITQAVTGQTLSLGDSINLQILSTTQRGATLLLTWKNFSMLIPFGITIDTIEKLQPKIQPVTALLLAESGYGPLNPENWLASLNPQLILLSVAVDDRQGLPDPEVLTALHGYTLLRTDQNGTIELITDGEQLWVEVEKP